MGVLTGRNAIVTGASRGIGRGVALALAGAGANVAVNYVSAKEEAEEVVASCQALGVDAFAVPANVGVQSEVEAMVSQVAAKWSRIDIGVSNAAYSDRELFHTADMAGFEKTIQVTMWGPFYFTRALANQMISTGHGGSIVVISSPHAWHPVPGAMAYNMAKAAIDQMALTAATELCQHRIRVNLLHPGWIDTPGERKFFSEEKLQRMGAELPWGRLGKPADIGHGVVFLCDPKSDYITGSSLLIDGGINLPVGEMHRLEKPA